MQIQSFWRNGKDDVYVATESVDNDAVCEDRKANPLT